VWTVEEAGMCTRPFRSRLRRHPRRKCARARRDRDVTSCRDVAETFGDKKLSYRRGTARCVVSVEIMPIAHASAQTTCTTSPEHIKVMKLEGYSWPMCYKHLHSTMTPSTRLHCPIGVINKPTTDELWISPVY